MEPAEIASPVMGWVPGVVGARLRRGVELPNRRIVGETDRVVHLIPVPATETMPEHLTALCDLEIRPGDAEHVDAGTGMPCIPCLNAVPRPDTTGVSEAADPR
ncbi:hypothetical protein [Amycolatopsis sp. NPDC051061]|uniref:hypothetical protein n=1 Tax=Amycolatopsis sp. NPDC051061 TaxID=3155042 RepID=UPI003414E766